MSLKVRKYFKDNDYQMAHDDIIPPYKGIHVNLDDINY